MACCIGRVESEFRAEGEFGVGLVFLVARCLAIAARCFWKRARLVIGRRRAGVSSVSVACTQNAESHRGLLGGGGGGGAAAGSCRFVRAWGVFPSVRVCVGVFVSRCWGVGGCGRAGGVALINKGGGRGGWGCTAG